MDEIRKKSIDEQVAGKGESMKGRVKKGLGKVTGNRGFESEGRVERGKGKAREKIGKVGRAASDAAERIKDKLRGYEE